jgi:hypothetical protein
VEKGNFSIQTGKKTIKWDTASGTLLTQGKVEIKQCCLPQFTRKRHITSTFHVFTKRPNDKYDVVLGRNFLQAIGLDIHYSASQFTWDNISTSMVPSGHRTQYKITKVAKSWNKQESELANEVQLTEIPPAEYKPIDINTVANQQTHLSPEEHEQLQNVLLTNRVITDFCGLSKCLVRIPYHIPKIPDILRGMEKFNFATTIDLNMGYYSMS